MRADAPPHGHLFLAGDACRKGDVNEALRRLDICQPLFEALDMKLFSSLALRQTCLLSGDADGVDKYGAEMQHLGVVNPQTWIDVYAPGFSD